MAEGYRRTRVTYQLGWLSAIGAFVYKLATFTKPGAEFADRARISPWNFLEAAILLFLICIANEAYASAMLRKGH